MFRMFEYTALPEKMTFHDGMREGRWHDQIENEICAPVHNVLRLAITAGPRLWAKVRRVCGKQPVDERPNVCTPYSVI